MDFQSVRDNWLKTGQNRFWQAFLTWLSGIPFTGQQEIRLFPDHLAQAIHILSNSALLFAGFFVSVYGWMNAYPILLLIGWAMMVRFLVVFREVYLHYYIHRQFKSSFSVFLLKLGIAFTLPPAFHDGIKQHGDHHKEPMGEKDTYEILRGHIIRAETSDSDSATVFYIKLVRYVLKPKSAAFFIIDRILGTIKLVPWHFGLLWTGLIAFSFATYLSLLIILLVPLLMASGFSALTNATAHHKPFIKTEGLKKTEINWSTSSAIFLGNIYPEHFWGRAYWYLTLFFWYLPIKVFVFPGDTGVHDAHHWLPKQYQWHRAAFWRRDLLLDGSRPYVSYASHLWGWPRSALICMKSLHEA